jgi:hypothetical protein
MSTVNPPGAIRCGRQLNESFVFWLRRRYEIGLECNRVSEPLLQFSRKRKAIQCCFINVWRGRGIISLVFVVLGAVLKVTFKMVYRNW